MPIYRLDLAYDGSGFHGYARQPELRTVQGEVDEALARLIGPVVTSVAGRTDAGVHARGQVVSFSGHGELDTERLESALNGMLGPEIAIWSVRLVEDAFDARRSARSRTYRYTVLNRSQPDPFRRHLVWHVRRPLKLAEMDRAAAAFVGEQDFASFCRSAEGRSTVRSVLAAGWTEAEPSFLRFEITATSFCHQMVRSLVALCVDVGEGRVAADEVPGIVEAADRRAGRGVAPPHGLVLWGVEYPEERGE